MSGDLLFVTRGRINPTPTDESSYSILLNSPRLYTEFLSIYDIIH